MTILADELAVNELCTSYGEFLERCSASLLYHAPAYLGALETIVKAGTPIILAAKRDGIIVGAMPLFLLRAERGAVLNSLPYFGSHGDILIAEDEPEPQRVAESIADVLAEFCARERVSALNIVSHPLTPWAGKVATQAGLKSWDRRIGQISYLTAANNSADALNSILEGCHQKTRNLVRKGLRGGFEIAVSDSDDDWAIMIEHHRLGMERIGGRAKSTAEFAALRCALAPRGMCRLHVARHKGAFAGALLNLYYRDWVEYFTPVAVDEYRAEQVMSALIATAMQDACLSGARIWNWGGTWPTQAGVYHFKKGWGAIDHPYVYYGAVLDERLAAASADSLREQFPFFYSRPFA